MKLYLLAGGLLLSAASVYGITDYIKTSNKKEFKDLYKEAPAVQKEEVKISDLKEEDYSRGKLESVPPPKEETKPAVAFKQRKSKVKSKKAVEAVEEKPQIELTPMPAKANRKVSDQDAVFASAPKERKTVKKKVNLKMFSRAAPVRHKEQVALTDSSYSNKH
jgi:hypothetical protein